MAEYSSSITDWTTVKASNVPADANNMNSTSANQYAGLANYFRDVKGVVRAESLNLGFDPSTTWKNSSDGEFLDKNGSDTTSFKVKGVNLGANLDINEGQMFFLEIYNGGSYIYYSGYVLALELSGSDTIVYVSGLTRWQETSSSQDHSGLSNLEPADAFTSTDRDKLDDQFNSISFSAYSPSQNLGWYLAAADSGNNQAATLSPVPGNMQSGTFRVTYDSQQVAVSFPHQEPDEQYSVSLTPVGYGGSPSATSYRVSEITKGRSLFVIDFAGKPNAATGGTSEYVDWDWEIHRDY